jgi:hypothetical protein
LVNVSGGAKPGMYILSNYHVFEADTVPGDNYPSAKFAVEGDAIIQPGLIDVSCNPANAQTVATLVPLKSLTETSTSNVDCSVAKVKDSMVDSTGHILGIGPLSAATIPNDSNLLNRAVKKSARTTGLTHSKVTGISATIRVTYENECAGGTAFTKTFTNQIVLANRGSSFLNGGDSGAALVEDVSIKPRAIGLLYAGSSTSAIANPIGEVLSFIGTSLGGTATMVGQ